HVAGKDIVALDESDVVEPRGSEQRVSGLHCFVTLDVLFPDVEQADAGLLEAVDVAGDDGAHGRKLTQLLWSRLGIRPEIEHLRVPVSRGYGGDDCRPFDTVDGLENEVRPCSERAGVTGADTRVRPPL